MEAGTLFSKIVFEYLCHFEKEGKRMCCKEQPSGRRVCVSLGLNRKGKPQSWYLNKGGWGDLFEGKF